MANLCKNQTNEAPSPPRQVTRMKSAFLLAVTVLLSSNIGVFSTPTPEVAKTPLISAESLTDKVNNPAKSAVPSLIAQTVAIIKMVRTGHA